MFGIHLRTTPGYCYTDRTSPFRPLENGIRWAVCRIKGHTYYPRWSWKEGCERCGAPDPRPNKGH